MNKLCFPKIQSSTTLRMQVQNCARNRDRIPITTIKPSEEMQLSYQGYLQLKVQDQKEIEETINYSKINDTNSIHCKLIIMLMNLESNVMA